MRNTVLVLFTLCFTLHLFAAAGNPPSPCKLTSDGDFEATIVFTGIQTFQMPQTSDDPMVVIMPSEKYKRDDLGAEKRDVPAHVPYLLADNTTMSKTNNPGIYFIKAHHEPATYHYIEFVGEQIVIDEQNALPDVNKRLCYSIAGTDPCPDSTTATSLRWIPSLGRVNGVTAFKKNVERFKPEPDLDQVAARITLRYGALDAHVTDARQWVFKVNKDDTSPKGPQAMAQEVHYRFRARGTQLVLHLIGFKGSYRRLTLTPQGGKVLLIVGNAMREDTGPIQNVASMKDDPHFLLYYTFAENDPHVTGRLPFENGTKVCTDAALYDPALKPIAIEAAPPAAENHPHDGGKPTSSGLNCPPSQFPR
jgi:hypothetical protein